MKRRALLALLGALPARPAFAAFKGGSFEPPHAAPAFALQGSDGRELTLDRYRGKVVLLAFGFTHCAAVCPVTLAVLAQARKQLGAGAADVQVLFVTVDPQRDDAARMKQYLAAFDAGFVGGTGTPMALEAVYQRYGVVAKRIEQQAGGYAVDHSSSVFMIDRQQRLRALMPYGRGADDFVHDLRLLLAQ